MFTELFNMLLYSHINKRTHYENPVLKKQLINAGKMVCVFSYISFLYFVAV